MSNLKLYRERANLSQAKLAEISGVSIRMIQKYETREKDINKAQALTVFRLAEALKCDITNLLEFDVIEED